MGAPVNESKPYRRVTANGNISSKATSVLGFLVTQATAGATVAMYDDIGVGTGTVVIDPMVVVAGVWYPAPFWFNSGVNVVLTGTVALTVSHETSGF